MYSFNRYHFPAIRYEAGWWMSTDSCINAGGVHVLPNINNVALMIYSACGYLESLKHDLPPDEYGQRIRQHNRTGNSYALLVRLTPRRERRGNHSD